MRVILFLSPCCPLLGSPLPTLQNLPPMKLGNLSTVVNESGAYECMIRIIPQLGMLEMERTGLRYILRPLAANGTKNKRARSENKQKTPGPGEVGSIVHGPNPFAFPRDDARGWSWERPSVVVSLRPLSSRRKWSERRLWNSEQPEALKCIRRQPDSVSRTGRHLSRLQIVLR